MNINKLKKEIEKEDWYRQEAAAKLFYTSIPWYGCQDLRINNRKIPQDKFKIFLSYEKYQLAAYFSKKSSEDIAKYYYSKQLKDDKFIEKLYRNWKEKSVGKFLSSIEAINKRDLSVLSNSNLINLFKNFNKDFYEVWSNSFFLDGFDYYGDIIIEDLLKKEDKEIKFKDFQTLLFSFYKSILQKERLSMLNIVEKINKKSSVKKYVLNNSYKNAISKYIFIENDLNKHSLEYNWINNDYAEIEYLDNNYFYKNIIELLKDKNKLYKEREFKHKFNTIRAKKKDIIRKYKLSGKIINTINFLSLMGVFREDRKAYNQMGCSVLNKFAKEISRRLEIKLDNIENLYTWEIEDIFNKRLELFEKSKKREESAFFIMRDIKKNVEFNGSAANELNKIIKKRVLKENELRGRAAYPGKVQGRAKIILNKRDFHKMKEGNILVAPNTRPEYVPIMKMARAIISDEGGVTCHSAIVSRELKIPCVVGAQTASIILKDGDLVEVDADEGLIKKLR